MRITARCIQTVSIIATVSPLLAATPFLDIVEHSSTSLTATYDGNPLAVTLLSPDNWYFQLPQGVGPFLDSHLWIEPEGNNTYNFYEQFNPNTDSAQGVRIISDLPAAQIPPYAFPAVPDGTVVQNIISFPSADFILVRFTDLEDAATVPDAGSTAILVLLGLTVVGLGGHTLQRRCDATRELSHGGKP